MGFHDHKFLKQVRDLVATGWTQNAYARNAAGDPVKPHSEEAVCWCLYGAAQRVAGSVPDGEDQLEGLIDPMLCDEAVDDWNDEPGRTQADVLALLDNRIKELAR